MGFFSKFTAKYICILENGGNGSLGFLGLLKNYNYYIIIWIRLVLKSCKTRIALKRKWGMWTALSQGLFENIKQNQLILNLYFILSSFTEKLFFQ